MTVAIWTPTIGSTETVVFDTLPRPDDFTSTVKPIASKVGAHLLIINNTCEVLFWSTAAPGSVAAGKQGVPIPPELHYVIPNPTAVSYLFSPYANGTVVVAAGTLT